MNTVFSASENQKNALLYGLKTASRLFWGPDDAHCREMLDQGLFCELAPIVPLLDIHPSDTLHKINDIIKQYPNDEKLYEYLETTYVSLFVSNRKGLVIPLYQSCYEYDNAPMMGASAVQMKERLAAVNLALASRIKEPPDHLAVELEYLYFLLTSGWVDGNVSLIKEASSFAADTMLPWVIKLYHRLMHYPDAEFYLRVVAVIIGMVKTVGSLKIDTFTGR